MSKTGDWLMKIEDAVWIALESGCVTDAEICKYVQDTWTVLAYSPCPRAEDILYVKDDYVMPQMESLADENTRFCQSVAKASAGRNL